MVQGTTKSDNEKNNNFEGQTMRREKLGGETRGHEDKEDEDEDQDADEKETTGEAE
jgi:hypothetical protein